MNLGIYWIQNLITAVVYRAFRGYFLNSIINSQLRRRVAVKASFEILRKRISNRGSIETRYYSFGEEIFLVWNFKRTLFFYRDTIPISIVETVVNSTFMNKWHSDRIIQVRE